MPRLYIFLYIFDYEWSQTKKRILKNLIACSVCTGVSSRGRSGSREQCCSAVSLLWDLNTFRQQEKDSLTKLNERWVNMRPAQPQIQMILIHIQHINVTYCKLYSHE